jgi:hypothetical protein
MKRSHRRIRRALIAQMDQDAPGAIVNGLLASIIFGIRDRCLRAPYPDYVLCNALNSAGEERARETMNSLVGFGVRAGLLLLFS